MPSAVVLPPRVPAEWIGAFARDKLTSPSATGRVLAVVSHAAYLITAGDEILWVARGGLPTHRRGVEADLDVSFLRSGMGFSVCDQALLIGNEVAIDLAHAEVWQPRPFLAEEAAPPAVLRSHLRQAWAMMRSMGGASMTQVLPLIAALAIGEARPAIHSGDVFLARALGPVERLARACLWRDAIQVAEAGEDLVGLGPGLTPSGDDFLGGLLFALHHLRIAYPTTFGWEARPIAQLLERARYQTNPISYTMLADLATGHGPEPLHAFMVALLLGQSPNEVRPHVHRLMTLGHTSGGDMLAGALTGLLTLWEA